MKDISDKEFQLIRDYIKAHFGISLGDEKKALVFSRLRTVLLDKGFDNFTQYYEYLIRDKTDGAVIQFIDKITTNHTFFMREVDHFDFFKETVLPYIERTYEREKDLRVWCAGCSSGEEPNTLQMLIQDHFAGKGWDTRILATDISTQMLDKAIQSVYNGESIKDIPEKWRKEYFQKKDGNNFEVSDKIKGQITYRRHNLMDERYQFKRGMHAIFCRNVMIYFDNRTRNQIIEKFYGVTEPGGYLFIGHSESISHTQTQYRYVMPSVYRKI